MNEREFENSPRKTERRDLLPRERYISENNFAKLEIGHVENEFLLVPINLFGKISTVSNALRSRINL